MSNSSLEQVKELIVEQEDGATSYPDDCYFEYSEGALIIYTEGVGAPHSLAIYHKDQWTKAYYTKGDI